MIGLAQFVYSAILIAILFAIFSLQRYRHRHACNLLWWTFTALAIGAGWELVDCWLYGPPGFPASRWVVMPALATIMSWAAVQDWRDQRLVAAIEADRAAP